MGYGEGKRFKETQGNPIIRLYRVDPRQAPEPLTPCVAPVLISREWLSITRFALAQS